DKMSWAPIRPNPSLSGRMAPSSLEGTTLRMKSVELLSELLADVFERGAIVSPVGPAGGDGIDEWIQETCLPEVQQHLGIFVILNTVTNGLEPDSRSRFGRSDRSWGIEEDSVTRSSEAATAGSGIHVVPAGDGVSSSPAVS